MIISEILSLCETGQLIRRRAWTRRCRVVPLKGRFWLETVIDGVVCHDPWYPWLPDLDADDWEFWTEPVLNGEAQFK